MAVVCRCVGILTVDVVFFQSPGVFHSQDSFPSTFRPRLWETSSGMVAVGVFAPHSQDSFPSTFRPRLWETSSGVVAVGVFAAVARSHCTVVRNSTKPGQNYQTVVKYYIVNISSFKT